MFLKAGKFLFTDTTLFQKSLCLCLIKCYRLRISLPLLNHLIQIFMYIFNGFVITFFAKCFRNKCIKCLFLETCRKWNLTIKHTSYKILLEFITILSIVNNTVTIFAPVIKCRKQKSNIRHIYHMALNLIVEFLLILVITKSRLRKCYRTNTA